jgi:hypothetical protein
VAITLRHARSRGERTFWQPQTTPNTAKPIRPPSNAGTSLSHSSNSKATAAAATLRPRHASSGAGN